MKLISPSSVLVTWDDQVADTFTLRLFLDTTKLRIALHNAAVNVFPDPPHRGAAWGLPRGLPGGLLFVQDPGVWGFSQGLSPGWNHEICLY